MPKELDFEPMPKRQQNVYIIWDSENSIADSAEDCKQHIDALVKQLQCEAQYHPDVAFNFCLTEYQDTYNWDRTDMFTLDPDEASPIYALPSVNKQEQSVWDTLSETVSSTAKNNHANGLSSYLPIFVFFVNKNDHLDFARRGEAELSANPYFLRSVSDDRRLILCADSIWDLRYQASYDGAPYDMDLIFPYRLFSNEVINHFMQIPKKTYQSGELASELLALHKPNKAIEKQSNSPENSDDQSKMPIDCEW